MNKYLQVAKVSLKQEIAYPVNFIMWRIRNVIQILLVYFLWNAAFSSPGRILFGYDRDKILTYVFGVMLVRAFVLSSKSMDVAGEISRGELSNSLVKPIGYFKYWLSRDISSKALNLFFAAAEIIVLYVLLRPPVFIQGSIFVNLLFFFSIIVAILLFTLILFLVSSITFWLPEMGWSVHFLVTTVVVEFLSGVLFPLDVFPLVVQKIINLTPFPYLVFFPLQVYLGKLTSPELVKGFAVDTLWLFVFIYILNIVWKKGLKVYEGYGR